MIRAQAANECAHQRSAKPGFNHLGLRKNLAKIAIDIRDTMF